MIRCSPAQSAAAFAFPGATTVVESSPDIEDLEIILNGSAAEAPVSRFVAERLARGPVRVRTDLDMPSGSGFGASGAGALGCAYALNRHFDLALTADQAASVAHEAEVVCRTGLGDVIAQNSGGMVLRLEAGAPGSGRIDRIPVPPSRPLCGPGPDLHPGGALQSECYVSSK